jgi:hypothetical protein
MNRCALVLSACLIWPTPFAAAQTPLKNSALEISVRFDDEPRVDQRIRTVDGASARILVGASRPVQKRQYIQTPVGPVPQEVTVVQEQTPAFEVVPRVLGQSVHVQTSASSAEGRLGEWFRLGAVAVGGTAGSATRTVWIKVDEVP